jgi:hypothetical protein
MRTEVRRGLCRVEGLQTGSWQCVDTTLVAATEHAVRKMITWKPSFNGNVALSRYRWVACLVEEMLGMVAFSA